MSSLTMRVNGQEVTVEVSPGAMLVDVLRDQLGLTGVKVGCGEGECGACTVLLDGEPVASCITPALKAQGRDVLTVEGLACPPSVPFDKLTATPATSTRSGSTRGGRAGSPKGGEVLHPIQKAFLAEGAVQCGFCTPGMLLAAKSLLDRNPDPTDDDIREWFAGHLCRCTGYNTIIAAVQRAAAALRDGTDIELDFGADPNVVGRAVVRKDGVAKVTGAHLYGADRNPRLVAGAGGEETLHAAAVFSVYPYAELLAMDTSRAEAMAGVVAVFTAKDVPGRNGYGIIIPHQPVFVPEGERVRSIGDVLALVVAESEAVARAAVERVRVEYRELEGVFSPREALAPDAPILHPPRPGDEPSNVMYGTHVEKGDVEAAIAEADVVVEGTFRTPFIEHGYLEPEAGTAAWDAPGTGAASIAGGGAPGTGAASIAGDDALGTGAASRAGGDAPGAGAASIAGGDAAGTGAASEEKGVVTVWMASQAVTFHHRGVAEVLGLPLEQVRLVHVSPGGGFGARNDMSLHPYLALAAYHVRRPVKMVLTRAESLRFHTKRHAMEHTARLGATRDGRLVALTCDILADTGAYSSAGIPVLDQATLFATGPYEIPNVRIKGLSVYTNNVPCGAMRGFGLPQSAFAIESLMDELTERLGMSPFELRRINGLRPGSTTATGQVLIESVPFVETLKELEGALEAAKAGLPPPAPGHKRGVGVASCYKNVGLGLGMPEPAGVGIDLMPDGRVLVRFGGADLGQGADTVVAQMAAQALGLPYTLIDVLACDTARTPDGGITSASRTTFMSGNAVVEAAPLFLERLRVELPDDATLTAETLADLAARLQAKARTISVEHTYNPPPTFSLEATAADERTNFVSFSYATQAAIVDVDEASGEVHVRKIIAAHDVGRTINPHGARGQIEGSCLMGLGYALSEEFILDCGHLATDTLAKVGIPAIKETPPVEVLLIEDPDPNGPYGAKGIAEAAAIPTAPAIVNAIYDAIGVRIRQLPATPDRVTAELSGGGLGTILPTEVM